MSTETLPVSIMTELRAATRGLHDEAEAHPFQRVLGRGELPQQAYADWLGQLLFVHASLEGRLRQLASANGVVRGIVDDEQFSESHLVEDLRHLGSDPRSHRPSDGTTELLSHLDHRAATCPVALLGSHYVLEGSKNGGRFIARAVRRAYGLSDAGTRYFDPYGDQQPERWRAFRASMDAAVFASDERAAIVETACETFAGITRIMQALWLSIAESSLAATTAG